MKWTSETSDRLTKGEPGEDRHSGLSSTSFAIGAMGIGKLACIGRDPETLVEELSKERDFYERKRREWADAGEGRRGARPAYSAKGCNMASPLRRAKSRASCLAQIKATSATAGLTKAVL